jgi:hypothetical protein
MRPTIRSLGVFLNVTLLLASLASSAFAKNPNCSDVGGAILTNVGGFGQIDGHLTTLGVATGDLKGAIGVEISGTNSSSVFSVQHHWVTDNGETLTIDPAQATGMFVNSSGLLAITDYKFHLSGGTGRFANATGDLSAIGEFDFSTGHGILRYSGQVCYGSQEKR